MRSFCRWALGWILGGFLTSVTGAQPGGRAVVPSLAASAIAGVAVEAAAGGPAPVVRAVSHGLEIGAGQGRVRLMPGNPAIAVADAGSRLEIEASPAARVHVGRGEGNRPEIRVILEGARAAEAPPVRLRIGRFLAEVGVRGRISLERGSKAHTVPVALIVQVADPAARFFPGTVRGPWHVVTFLTKNEMSDLDSRYWLGGAGGNTDRIQFSEEEYRQLGVDFESLKRERLGLAGKSGKDGKGDDVLMIPPAVEAIKGLVAAAPGGKRVRFSDLRSGFRSYEDQERSWKNNITEAYGKFHQRTGLLVHEAKVAVPGYSQHGTGGAVDFSLANAEDAAFRAAALDHGLIRSEIRTRWRKGGFENVWLDRPHFLFIGHDLQPVLYFPSPEDAARGSGR